MPENNENEPQKTAKSKKRLIATIIRWLFVVVFAVLLILGLFFQAPWKVLVIFAIFLAALTVLPRPYRKYFWGCVGVVVIAIIIWVFLPDDNEGWQPFTFDDEQAALEAKYAVPNEENAAKIYLEMLKTHPEIEPLPEKETESEEIMEKFTTELVEKGTAILTDKVSDSLSNYEKSLEYITRNQPWSSKDCPEVAEWLERYKGIIKTLLEASRKSKCRFQIPTHSADLDMERMASMRRWAILLIRAANNDLGDGRFNQAVEKNLAVLQMAKHQRQQPTIIDLLVGMAMEALAFRQFNGFVVTGDATEERLNVIESALADIKHDWSSDLPRILECEKLLMKNMLGMFYEINPKGKVRLNRDPTAAIRTQFPQDMSLLTYWQKKFIKAETILGWFFMPSTPQKAAKIIDASYEKLYAMAEPDYDWQKGPRKFSLASAKFNYPFMVEMLLYIMEPSYYRIHDLYLRVMTDKRGNRIITALRRYKNKNGVWPESLDDIKSLASVEAFIDPQNGGAFIYKLTEENFTLYSKGKNNIDEDGRYRPLPGEEIVPDDWLIWPPRLSSNDEEGADPNDEE